MGTRTKPGTGEESPTELSEGGESPRGGRSLPEWLSCAVPSVRERGRPPSAAAVKYHKPEEREANRQNKNINE